MYVEFPTGDDPVLRRADVAVVASDSGPAEGRQQAGSASAVTTTCTLPMPEERRETYLVIRERTTQAVITVIELLSPTNKRAGSNGRVEYLRKRDEVLASPTHLVEIDLLRGGLRLPVVGELPLADYYCIISRSYQRPRADLLAWNLPDPLPTIAIPLKRGDDDASVNLQEILSSVCERAGYDLSLDYDRRLDPAFPEERQAWLREQIAPS